MCPAVARFNQGRAALKIDTGSLTDGYLDIPFKGGHNDLSRWKRFGGKLERPAPPAPMNVNSSLARPASTDS